MTRIVVKAKALDMILFSTRINPRQALEAGLANQLAAPDKLIDTALEFAGKLVKRPPLAVGCVLKAISAGEYEGFERGLEVEEAGIRVYRGRQMEDDRAGLLERAGEVEVLPELLEAPGDHLGCVHRL